MTDKTREAIKAEVNNQIKPTHIEFSKGFIHSGDLVDAAIDATLDRLASLITAQADVVTDAKRFGMGIVNQLFDLAEVPVDLRQSINDRADEYMAERLTTYAALLRSKLAQPKKDGCVTDDDIQAEAMSYASKPLAPYLRSEVFADGARWGISKRAAPKTD